MAQILTLALATVSLALPANPIAPAADQHSARFSIEILALGTAAQAYPGAACINDRGDVAGFLRYDRPTRYRGVVWRDGQPMELPGLGGLDTFALGLNARGDVVGVAEPGDTDPTGAAVTQAVRWTDGTVVQLGSLGGRSSFAIGVDNSGVVVGSAQTGEVDSGTGLPITHACSWDKQGRINDLGTLGGTNAFAIASTPNGVVLGAGEIRRIDPSTGVPVVRSFRILNGLMSDLGDLGGNGCRASAMSYHGVIVGSADTTEVSSSGTPLQHAFLWRDGLMVDLGTLGGAESFATGINSRGQIVGASNVPRTPSGVLAHGCLWDQGRTLDLNDLVPEDNPWEIVEADCISERGEIPAVGRRGFLDYILLLLRPTASER